MLNLMTFTSLPLVACPCCGGTLRWAPDRWLAAFECDCYAPFSDVGTAFFGQQDRTARARRDALEDALEKEGSRRNGSST